MDAETALVPVFHNDALHADRDAARGALARCHWCPCEEQLCSQTRPDGKFHARQRARQRDDAGQGRNKSAECGA